MSAPSPSRNARILQRALMLIDSGQHRGGWARALADAEDYERACEADMDHNRINRTMVIETRSGKITVTHDVKNACVKITTPSGVLLLDEGQAQELAMAVRHYAYDLACDREARAWSARMVEQLEQR